MKSRRTANSSLIVVMRGGFSLLNAGLDGRTGGLGQRTRFIQDVSDGGTNLPESLPVPTAILRSSSNPARPKPPKCPMIRGHLYRPEKSLGKCETSLESPSAGESANAFGSFDLLSDKSRFRRVSDRLSRRGGSSGTCSLVALSGRCTVAQYSWVGHRSCCSTPTSFCSSSCR